MNVQKVTAKLKKRYPGKSVVITDPNNPTEIICETKPTEEHPKWSEAIAVVDKIRPHYHNILTETYEILEGKLTVYLSGEKHDVLKGNSITIKPKVVHWAEGNEVWFKVYSKPGWTPEDHILVYEDKEASRKEIDK